MKLLLQGCVRYSTGSRHRYGCRTELTEVSGTGIDVVPNLPKCSVPVLELYRTYRSVRQRYESMYRYRRYWYRCAELTEVFGTGIDAVPNVPKFPVPELTSYRTYRSFRCRYWYRTELTEVPVPVLMSYRTYRSVQYRYKSLYRYRYTLEYIHRQYRRYIPPARYRCTLAHRYINWT